MRHGDGTRVLDWRLSGGLEALAVLGSMDASTIGALFEARRLLLVEAAAKAFNCVMRLIKAVLLV